ncbi:hypothetical protein BYT27DRAFT_7080948 [Phlegmacium glaucopus]|nr:hypothetical protein BYT27DRAFT_7080948 [Phlegmacium glaucopus]
MACKVQSATKKKQALQEEHSKCMARTIAIYQEEQAKDNTVKKLGLQAVCSAVEKEYFKETGKVVSLNHNTC